MKIVHTSDDGQKRRQRTKKGTQDSQETKEPSDMAKKKVSHVFVFPGKTEINQVRFYKIRLANTAKCTTAFVFL